MPLNPLHADYLPQKVVAVAKSFVGLTEVGNNAGFSNPAFRREMMLSGFLAGMPWCSLLCETIFRKTLLAEGRKVKWELIEPLFSASAVETLNRFAKKGYTIRQTPKVGDLVVWRFGPGPKGHIGIVIELGTGKKFTTVEGNTSGKVADRDGGGVWIKPREYGKPVSSNPKAFNLIGFVAPV